MTEPLVWLQHAYKYVYWPGRASFPVAPSTQATTGSTVPLELGGEFLQRAMTIILEPETSQILSLIVYVSYNHRQLMVFSQWLADNYTIHMTLTQTPFWWPWHVNVVALGYKITVHMISRFYMLLWHFKQGLNEHSVWKQKWLKELSYF
jgi:hypothetical protein